MERQEETLRLQFEDRPDRLVGFESPGVCVMWYVAEKPGYHCDVAMFKDTGIRDSQDHRIFLEISRDHGNLREVHRRNIELRTKRLEHD